jgi:hypothetical protein
MLCIGTALIEMMLGEGERRDVIAFAHLIFANLSPAHKGTLRRTQNVLDCTTLTDLCDRLKQGFTY